jgi:WD40 repeat protein
MNRLRRGCWVQLAAALAVLAATGAYYAYLARALPPVPRATIRTGYPPSVHIFSSDSKVLVTRGTLFRTSGGEEVLSESSQIDLWDVATGAHCRTLDEDGIGVEVELSADARLLLAKHPSERLTLWDATSGKLLARLRPDPDRPFSPYESRFSPDGRFVLMSSPEGGEQIIFWEVATQTEQARIDGWLKMLQFATDGKRFTVWRFDGDGRHCVVQRWETPESEAPRMVLERRVVADNVAVSPDLETIVTARRRPNEVAELSPASGQRFLPSSTILRTIPVLSAGCIIQFWDMSTGAEKLPPIYFHVADFVNSLEFSRSGRFLLAGGDDLSVWVVWDTSAGFGTVGHFSARPEVSPRKCWVLVNTPSGPEVWAADGGGEHFDLHRASDRVVFIQRDKGGPISSSCAQFSPDDRWVVASGLYADQPVNPIPAMVKGQWDGSIRRESDSVCRLWDVENRKEVATFRGSLAEVLSPDGRTLLIIDHEDRLRLYDVPPPRPWGVPLALTVATWGLALLACWAVKRRVRRWRKSLATAATLTPS